MNKKTVIIIVSVIAALAIATTATIAILSSNLGGKSDKKDDKNNVSSSENAKNDTDSAPSTDSTASQDETTLDGDNSDIDNSVISIPAAPNDITTFIGANATANIGGKVSVPIFVSSNKGFLAVFGSLKYDTSVLKYTGYKKGNLFANYEFLESNGEIKFMLDNDKDITKDGVLYYVEFDVVAKNPTTTTIEFAIAENMVANQSVQYVKFETVNGSVTIK